MVKLIYSELSYKVVGVLYEVYNQLGYGHREKVYQNAIAQEFEIRKIIFKREVYFPVLYKEKIISKYYYDFVIEDKLLLEIKVSQDFYQSDISQVLAYLKSKKYRLGILAVFSSKELKYKRIVN